MQVCPWCEMEISKDIEWEEDARCPYCDNDLGSYRTVNLQPDQKNPKGGVAGMRSTLFGELDLDEELELDDYPEEEWSAYEQKVRDIQDNEEDTWACSVCNESMIQLGEMTVSKDRWKARRAFGMQDNLLEAPFDLSVWLCPGCFRVEHSLGGTDKEELIHRWSKEQTDSEKKD